MLGPIWGIVVLVCGMITLYSFYERIPASLRGHWGTALLWTLISVISLAPIALGPQPQPIAWLIYSVSSWTMVASWRELSVRRRMHASEIPRSHRTPYRLFTRTVLGPISLILLAIGIYTIGNRMANNAVAQRDFVHIHLLSHYGFNADWPDNNLNDAISRGDLPLIAASLEAQPYRYLNSGMIAQQNNIAVTALILRYDAASLDGLLISAVEANNVIQASYLLNHGANADATIWVDGEDIPVLQKAKQLHNKQMVTLLQSASAKK